MGDIRVGVDGSSRDRGKTRVLLSGPAQGSRFQVELQVLICSELGRFTRQGHPLGSLLCPLCALGNHPRSPDQLIALCFITMGVASAWHSTEKSQVLTVFSVTRGVGPGESRAGTDHMGTSVHTDCVRVLVLLGVITCLVYAMWFRLVCCGGGAMF